MKTKIKRRLFPLCISVLYVLAAGHPVLAEDIEVLVGPGGLARMKPNVLFIMDTSSSMGWTVAGNPIPNEDEDGDGDGDGDGDSRLSILKGVFKDLMENPSYQGINVALMRFTNNNNGGYFVSPMQELNSDTREDIIDASDKLYTDGQTPLSETLYEAALFWGGETVDYGGRTSHINTNVSGVSDADGNYISPISNSECQKNYTILLTDGDPREDMLDNIGLDANGQSTKVYQYISNMTNCLKGENGDCLDDIAKYLNTVDQSPDIPGTQTVQTYTIGFTTNLSLLQQTADAGGGTYVTADSEEKLEEAFTSILNVITNANDSFSPPALAANTFNGIAHINRLYYTLFEPAATPKWNGNIKPYELNDAYQLVDADSRPVIDANGIFLEQSRSFWSGTDDGANIVIGGANNRLPVANNRNLYTYTGDYDDETGLVPDVPKISDPKNALENSDNSDLTADMLDISITDDDDKDSTKTNAEFTRVLDAIRGAKIGAPLHSQPVLVTYGGSDAENADLTLFVTTNDGFLHALDASPKKEGTTEGGRELFAFIPKELLPNLPKLVSKTGSMVYGLDGGISAWVKESDDPDFDIEAGDGDHVYIYIGMRRGGNNYYALDVTDRTAPTLKWVIRGGPDGTPDFKELGQSWSKPTLASIKVGNDTKKVLIFGGGYNKAQDDNPLNADARDNNDDTIGRAIFIVDANTGKRLWWAGPEDSDANRELEKKMTHSIPSDIRLMDSNSDGHTDRLYVGDMRGQIFRIDLKPTLADSTGVLLASLSGETEADNRRFYYPPDVVLTQRHGAPPYVSINIGSGYRAHPLNHLTTDGDNALRVNDRFYSLRDPHVGPIPTDVTIIPMSDDSDDSDHNNKLVDATDGLVANSTEIDVSAATGWYITLGDGSGEKVLAPSITINGEILFTTYTPPEAVENSECGPPPGKGRLYRVSLFDATSTRSLEDRATLLDRPGIPPPPTIMFRENSCDHSNHCDKTVEMVGCVGTQCEKIDNPDPIQEIYWQDGT